MKQVLMTWLIVGSVALLVVAKPPRKTDEEGEEPLEGPEGLKVFVGRKGGTIRIYRSLPDSANKTGRKTGQVSVAFFRIQEVDVNGNDIRGNRNKVNNPGNVGFNCSVVRNQNIQQNASGDSILADCLNCGGPLKDVDDSMMTLTVCVTRTNGTLILGDEDSEVKIGQLKFSVQLDNWPWSEQGQYIDVDVNMKIPPGRSIRRRTDGGGRRKKPVIFGLGEDADASFSTKVKTDNDWVTMPGNFPSYSQRGANNIISLRIPRFNVTGFYDPTIEVGVAAQTDDDTSKAPVTSYPAVGALFLTIVGLLASHF